MLNKLYHKLDRFVIYELEYFKINYIQIFY